MLKFSSNLGLGRIKKAKSLALATAMTLSLLQVTGIAGLAGLSAASASPTNNFVVEANGTAVSDGQVVHVSDSDTTVAVHVSNNVSGSTFTINGGSTITNSGTQNITLASDPTHIEVDLQQPVYGQPGQFTSLTKSFDVVADLNADGKSTDSTLSAFSINGTSVLDFNDGQDFNLDPYTTSVDVVATANNLDATAEVLGDSAHNLQLGDNPLRVLVTAADGVSTRLYNINLRVATGSNTDLSTFTVNGVAVNDNDTFNVDYGTTSLDVVATTTDPYASYEVYGNGGFSVGDNTLTVEVWAADGTTQYLHSVTVHMLANSDTSLATFQVNGEDVTDGQLVTLDAGVTATVNAVATDSGATVAVTGADDLVTGDNPVTILVTAADGVSTQTYYLYIHVNPSTNTALSTFTVNGSAVADGDIVSLDNGTASVAVVAETADPDASLEITGDTDLVEGDQLLHVIVLAADGTTSEDHTVTLRVAASSASNDATLSTLEVNGNAVADGDTVTLDAGVTATVNAIATDLGASVVVSGAGDLVTGDNPVTIVVTAADGVSTRIYYLTIHVNAGTNTDLSTFTVNGNAVIDGDIVNLDNGTTSVAVVAETLDPDASYEIIGADNLVTGDNTLTVDVTAADGTTTAQHSVTLHVADSNNASNDTSLSYIKINGWWAHDNQTRYLSANATTVAVELQTSDSGATYQIFGQDNLVTGVNLMSIMVTAPDGSVGWHYFYLLVPDVSGLSPGLDVQVYNTQTSNPLSGISMDLCPNSDTHAYLIQADWGDGVTAGCQPDDVVVRYTGFVTFPDSGLYSFRGWADDGFYMSLDGKGIITQDWSEKGASGNTYQNVPIVGGHKYVFEAWFYEHGGQATVTLQYDTNNGNDPQDVVPAAYFSADGTFPPSTAGSNTGATISIDGTVIADSGTYTALEGTTAVNPYVVTDNPYASYTFSGNTDLVAGQNNTVTVTVTSADGTVQDHTFSVYVPYSSDSALDGWFYAYGNWIPDGGSVNVPNGTSSVDVNVYADSPYATTSVSGNTDLHTGTNHVTVVVTAQDGSSTTYGFDIIVAQSSDTGLGSVTIDSNDNTGLGTIVYPAGTTSVEVSATASNIHATAAVSGTTGLRNGYTSTISILVTAEDGSTQTYTFDVLVLADDNSALGSITVNGDSVEDGGSYNVASGVQSVTVVATPAASDAYATVSGADNLHSGANHVTVVVYAENGTSTTYGFDVIVAQSNDASLSSLSINGQTLADGDTYNADGGTTQVTVDTITNDSHASVSVSGNTNLQIGDNTVTVTVTAEDGSTQVYTIIVNVPFVPSNDSSLAVFTVNGHSVIDGQPVNLPFGTGSVEVVATPNSEFATFEITGATNLNTGDNLLVVVVTAEDETITTYEINLHVEAQSSDSSLSSLTVNGENVFDGAFYDVANGTTDVEIAATTTDPGATFTITGGSNLVTGENQVSVLVTAADGTQTTYSFVVRVAALSSNTDLATYVVNGSQVSDNDTITLPYGSTFVSATATTADAGATVTISGNTDLQPGSNFVTATVVAADGTNYAHVVQVVVDAASQDASIVDVTVDGTHVDANGTIHLAPGTTSANIVVTTNDSNATYSISGGSSLSTDPAGNAVVVTATAQDGVTQSQYSFTIVVDVISSDAGLSYIHVNGGYVADGDYVTVAYGTPSVTVDVQTSDVNATAAVSGADALHTGTNHVTIVITAQDGTQATYGFDVIVSPNTDSSLALIQVNGLNVSENDSVTIGNNSTTADVAVTTTDPAATFEVSDVTALQPGDNLVTITVTAADGVTTSEHFFTIKVPGLSSDARLDHYTVNGCTQQQDCSSNLPAGTKSMTVVAYPTDPDATYTVSGTTGLVLGMNAFDIVVTAADGTRRTYTNVVYVAASSDSSLGSLSVNATTVDINDAYIALATGSTTADIVGIANDAAATVSVSGPQVLSPGDNNFTVTVTAQDGSSTDYPLVVHVIELSNDVTVAAASINDQTVDADGHVFVDAGTTSVNFQLTTNDSAATYQVTGTTSLITGQNQIVVVVTAADGITTQTYYYWVNVASLSNDTSLSAFTVYNTFLNFGSPLAVEDGALVELAHGITSVDVTATATDSGATVNVAGGSNLVVGDNTVTVTVAAADGTVATYSLTLRVAASDDSSFTVRVNGTTVDNTMAPVLLAPGTTSANVVVIPTDAGATVEVGNADSLVAGDNFITITVTAADGVTVSTIQIDLYVQSLSNDSSVSSIQFNGTNVDFGNTFTVAAGTTSVAVSVVTTSSAATFEVTGADNLEPGDNPVSVVVTAEDGTSTTYNFIVHVTALSTDGSLGTFTVNDNAVTDGMTVNLDEGTTFANVVALANGLNATVDITGQSDLHPGDNDLVVTVTAEDGSVTTYHVTLHVALSSDTTLSTFTVNGNPVEDGDTFTTDADATSAALVAVPTAVDAGATVSITGDPSNLVLGDNNITVTVTAANGVDQATYGVNIYVPMSSDGSLSTFQVDGEDVADGDVVTLPYGTTSVEVNAIATHPAATVEISGGTDLQPGENSLTVTVTAEDQSTTDHTVTLFVNANTDTTLSTFTVNGSDVADGDNVDLDPYTTSVDVVATATDENANVEITGNTDLVSGVNTLTVNVTAADGVTTQTYTVTLTVAAGDDTSVTSLQVNGADVADGDTVELDPYTASVDVTVTTSDPDATVEITGDTDLVSGDNPLSVVVTAADGVATQVYLVNLHVAPGNSTELTTFQVNGADVVDGDTVTLDYGTTSVDVLVETADLDATYEIIGDTDLQTGDNTLTVTVTAADGTTTQDYNVTLTVAVSTDTSLSVFQVNGADVVDGDTVTLDYGTTSVDVVATPTDENATVEITGDTDLQTGDNTLTVTVTAADGTTTQDYNVTLTVSVSVDTGLSVFTVNGNDVVDGDTVNLDYGTTSVEVVATTTDTNATVEITGDSGLVTGDNTLTVTVTAADGVTTQDYNVTLTVAANSDASLSAFKVNGGTVTNGGHVTLAPYTTSVDVVATSTDADATVEITGDTDLVAGDNTLTVTVTAADGTTISTYTVTLTVPLGDDVTASSFQIAGNDVVDGDSVTADYGTDAVDVAFTANDPGAQVVVTGDTGLHTGSNQVTVTVTSASGTVTKVYHITVVVAQNNDNSLATFQVNGVDANDGDEVDLNNLDLAHRVVITAIPTDSAARVVYKAVTRAATFRTDLLGFGDNNLVFSVIAANGDSVDYHLNLHVNDSSDTSLKTFTVNGVAVSDGSTVSNLKAGTQSVTVVAVATNDTAIAGQHGASTVTIDGSTGLQTGDNTLTVEVTAPDGTVQDYTVTLNVLASTDTSLKVFTVNGTTVTDGGKFVVAPTDTSADIVATPTSDAATADIAGGDSLVSGLNQVAVTVTAESGATKVFHVTVVVPSQTTAVITFAKGVLTVDKKNAAGLKALTALLKTVAKKTYVSITVDNNFLVKGDKAAAALTRYTNITKALTAGKVVAPTTGTKGTNTTGATVVITWY